MATTKAPISAPIDGAGSANQRRAADHGRGDRLQGQNAAAGQRVGGRELAVLMIPASAARPPAIMKL